MSVEYIFSIAGVFTVAHLVPLPSLVTPSWRACQSGRRRSLAKTSSGPVCWLSHPLWLLGPWDIDILGSPMAAEWDLWKRTIADMSRSWLENTEQKPIDTTKAHDISLPKNNDQFADVLTITHEDLTLLGKKILVLKWTHPQHPSSTPIYRWM